MAKAHNKTVTAALARIQSTGRATVADKPLVEQGLIEVNPEDVVNEEAAARLTQKGIDGMPKAPVQNAGAAPGPSAFPILKGIVMPESKRGAGRVAGPPKYPFDTMEKGDTFFVPVSAEVPNPLKTLGSAVSNATNKYRVDTGKVVEKVRTKRGEGNKAVLDASGAKVKEKVQVAVYEYPRKFTIRGVKVGQVCGGWTAPADGVLIGREI